MKFSAMKILILLGSAGICSTNGQQGNIDFGYWAVSGNYRTRQDSFNLTVAKSNFLFGAAGGHDEWFRDTICDPNGIKFCQQYNGFAAHYPWNGSDSDKQAWMDTVNLCAESWANRWSGHIGAWGWAVGLEYPEMYDTVFYPGIQYVCAKLHDEDSTFKTMGQGGYREIHFPEIFESCPDLDVIGFSHYWFRGNSPYSDQTVLDSFVNYSANCNQQMRLFENLNRPKPTEWYAIIQTHREYRLFDSTQVPPDLWGKMYRLFRRPKAEEIRSQAFLSLAYGAKGVIYYGNYILGKL